MKLFNFLNKKQNSWDECDLDCTLDINKQALNPLHKKKIIDLLNEMSENYNTGQPKTRSFFAQPFSQESSHRRKNRRILERNFKYAIEELMVALDIRGQVAIITDTPF